MEEIVIPKELGLASVKLHIPTDPMLTAANAIAAAAIEQPGPAESDGGWPGAEETPGTAASRSTLMVAIAGPDT